MVFILFISWSGIPQNAAYAQKTARLSEEERKKAVEKLEKLFDALEEVAKEIPRDTFDPQTIVDKVGKDPIKLFEWVRDNTYLVPYRGSLRGPIGVLMDRLGNSLERALLLHKLLTIAGHKARLVQGSLTKEQSEMVLKKARPIPSKGALPAQEDSPQKLEELIAKYADKYGLDPIEIKRNAQNLTVKQQHIAEEVAQRVDEQTKAILELIGEIPDIREAEWAKEVKALHDHWWVQWKRESAWFNLDPSLPNSQIGYALTKEKRLYQPDGIGDDHIHLVTIRLVIERLEEDKLKEETVLEHTLRPSALLGKRIVLRHVPLTWPKDLDLFAGREPFKRIKQAIFKEKEWLPVLSVGSEQIWQTSFWNTGQINNNPGKESVSESGAGIRRGFSLFGPTEEKSKKESHLTAEWIEYEIHVLENTSRKTRRQIFDLIGPALRETREILSEMKISKKHILNRGLALLNKNEILLQVCHISKYFLAQLIVRNFLSNRKVLTDYLHQADFTKNLVGLNGRLSQLPGPVYGLALARSVWGQLLGNIYLNSLNIISYSWGILLNSQGEVIFYQGFDMVQNQIAVHSISDENPYKIRLEHGVLSTNIEALLAGRLEKLVENTAELFMIANSQDVKWLKVQNAQDSDWKQAIIPNDARIRIGKDLEDGYLILVPKKGIWIKEHVHMGWWRVDPKTGDTLGIGENGWGQAKAMYAIILRFIVIGGMIACWFLNPGYGFFFCIFAGAVGVAAIPTAITLQIFILSVISIVAGNVASAVSHLNGPK
jgi:hypothetical protein